MGLQLPRTVMRYDGAPFNRPNYHPFRGIREEEEAGGSAGGNNDMARPETTVLVGHRDAFFG